MSVPIIRSVAVIGSKGQMGGLFLARCAAAGLRAVGFDRPLDPARLAAELPACHLTLLAVPEKALADVLEVVTPCLAPDSILADVTSLKVHPLASMMASFPGPVVGTHPLFGPEPPEGAAVAVVPGRDEAACAAVEAWIAGLGFDSFRTTAEEHDQAMALIQGLNFVTTVSYLATLSYKESLRRFLTPSFHRRLESARKMLTEDADLFASLFEANPYSQDAVRHYRNFLHLAAGGDVDVLVERAGWWWEDPERGAGGPGPSPAPKEK